MLLRPVLIVGSMMAGAGLLWACASRPSPGPTTRKLTEADAGSSVELQVGDKLEVTLPGNPTTGFTWEVGGGDPAILRPSGEAEFQADSTAAVGSGGKLTLRFEAVAAGQTGLKLIYHRPFEADVTPIQTFEVSVTVK